MSGCIELDTGLKIDLSILTAEKDMDADLYELEVTGTLYSSTTRAVSL